MVCGKTMMLIYIIEVDEEIARNAGIIKDKYGKSHGTGMVDAIIAASARKVEAELITLNIKHYPMFERIGSPYKKF